jgi:hypothetical protein
MQSVRTGKNNDEESRQLLNGQAQSIEETIRGVDKGFGKANGEYKSNPFDLNDSDSEDDHLEQDRFNELIYFKDQFSDLNF